MDKTQKKYALQRLQSVQNGKLLDAKRKYEIKEERLSDTKRVDLIYQGKVKLLPREKVQDSYTDLADSYDFSKFETASGFKGGYGEVCSVINKAGQDASDQIMLGDCNEALKLIQKLENMKV